MDGSPSQLTPAARTDGLTVRPWDRRRDRRQQETWPAPDHPLMHVWTRTPSAGGPRESWAIDLAGMTIGRLTLRERAETQARLGIYLAPPWVGQGYGRAALRLFLDRCFRSDGLQRIDLDVAASNQRALACYLALGFQVRAHTWRAVADPNLIGTLLQLPDYWQIRAFFRPGAALFYELDLTSDAWTR